MSARIFLNMKYPAIQPNYDLRNFPPKSLTEKSLEIILTMVIELRKCIIKIQNFCMVLIFGKVFLMVILKDQPVKDENIICIFER